MWPRDLELALGLWLWASPFVFRVPPEHGGVYARAFGCGAAVIALALACYVPRLRRAHLVTLGVGAWLAVHGRFLAETALQAFAQSEILTGLALGLFAFVPSRASEPPPAWRRG